MKKSILFSFIVITIIGICSCNKKRARVQTIKQTALIIDLTDPLPLQPDADPILRLYRLDKDINVEVFFRLCRVTDRQINTVEDFHLNNGVTTEKDNKFDDPQQRQKLILSFYQTIRKALSDFSNSHSKDSSLRYSECFKTIAGELTTMKKKKADENTLLVFSDMQENSDLFSTYTKHGQKMLFNHPDKVATLFEQTKLLPGDLKGFNIFFVFEPRSRADDKVYVTMVGIYKTMLEKRGAKVTVQASNKSYGYE